MMNVEGAPLDQVLEYVERAVRGDRRLLVQLFRQFQLLAHHPDAPDEERRLGAILSRVLMGERRPDLNDLPEDMTADIEALLERLNRSAAAAEQPHR